MSGYSKEELGGLRDFYRAGLMDDTLPFWLPEVVDQEFGGYLAMRDRDGSLIDDDKSVWLQGRFAWVLATLCKPAASLDLCQGSARLWQVGQREMRLES